MAIHYPRFRAREAVTTTLLTGLLCLVGGPPAPGLPALLARVEVLTGWPLAGLAWAMAIGALAAWAARLTAGLGRLAGDDSERAMVLAAALAPAVLPGAGVVGLVPALWLGAKLAIRTDAGGDRRVALMLGAAIVGTIVDPRVAPAGAVAIVAAARPLLCALGRPLANDNAIAPFAWRVAPGHLQGSCPQFISE